MNFFDCALVSDEGGQAVRLAGQVMPLSGPNSQARARIADGRLRVGVRPGDISFVRPDGAPQAPRCRPKCSSSSRPSARSW